jgi:cephalosporin-C deacetylase
MMRIRQIGFAASALMLAAAMAGAQEVSIAPGRETGMYKAGEAATWTVTLKEGATPAQPLSYRVKTGGYVIAKEGTLSFTGGKAKVEMTGNTPGWLLLEVDAKDKDGKPVKALGGAVFSPERIGPAGAKPSDFDTFWDQKIASLRSAPINAKATPEAAGREGVDYELLTMDGWKGAKIHGQVAKPKSGSKLPALLIVQWAGVYSLQKSWAADRAAEGWLVCNIQAHELPALGTEAFFKEQADGPLRGYSAIGAESRETSYFLRMYLSCVRAADYLASRPEWDGKVMVVTGGSQGGLQAFVTAALHPKITGVTANVPAGCDQQGPEVGRAPGWPSWPWMATWEGREKDKVLATAPYFDVVHFAARIKAPVLAGIGGIDTVCPPPGIFAALNLVKGPREAVYMPLADHMGRHDAYYQRVGVWMDALKAGSLPSGLPKAP